MAQKKWLFLPVLVSLCLCLSGCDTAEKVAEEIRALLPNDIEALIPDEDASSSEKAVEERCFSEGYANMLRSGTYYITYSAEARTPDGTSVVAGEAGAKGGGWGVRLLHAGQESHTVWREDALYVVDQVNATATAISAGEYQAVGEAALARPLPQELSYLGSEQAVLNGKVCKCESYSGDGTELSFYFEDAILYAMEIRQAGHTALWLIEEFNKYTPSELTSFPRSYTVITEPAEAPAAFTALPEPEEGAGEEEAA